MTVTDDQCTMLVAHVRGTIGTVMRPLDLSGKGLALCVIDSIQSTGVRYTSVKTVLNRYIDHRAVQESDAYTDRVSDLINSFDELGGPTAWASQIGNQHKTSTGTGAPLKAVAVCDVAQLLQSEGIETRDDMQRFAGTDRLEELSKRWRSVVGQRSGITWQYFLMLAGVPGVKPDRMIKRFVASALDMRVGDVGSNFAAELVTDVAHRLELSPTDLDHAIWNWQRVQRPGRSKRSGYHA